MFFGWTLAVFGAVFSVYFRYDDTRTIYETMEMRWTHEFESAYESVHRAVWACSVSWVVVACIAGNGGRSQKFGVSHLTTRFDIAMIISTINFRHKKDGSS